MSNVVYLAGRYTRREELCGYRADLADRGWSVPAAWLEGTHQVHGVEAARAVEAGGPVPSEQAVAFALDDQADVTAADVVVAFTEEPRQSNSRGGRHVELGLALERRRRTARPFIYVVGPLENVFCALADRAFYDWPAFLEWLDDTGSWLGDST